jgi:hypothetical protein
MLTQSVRIALHGDDHGVVQQPVEELLAQTINVAADLKLIKQQELASVIVDSTVQPKQPAHAINKMWSMDFVPDAVFDGRKLPMLTLVDLFARERLTIDV